MLLQPYVATVVDRLDTVIGLDDERRPWADRLVAALEPAMRLAMLDALAAAAAELSSELAPGAVEIRLRAGEPELVVVPAPQPAADEGQGPPPLAQDVRDEGDQARVNLRLPESLKARADAAAAREGLSTNAWIVRAVAAATDRPAAGTSSARPGPRGSERFTGWAG